MSDSLIALAADVGARLQEKGALLVTAESCTGGGVAHAVTAIAGSSAWFERGFIAYSNAAKEELLGVSREALQRSGAVSEEVAQELARGALRHSNGSVAVAVTGVAGPTGGTAAKPVGLVCFAWATRQRIWSESRQFAGDRESVRRQSVTRALQGLLEVLGSA